MLKSTAPCRHTGIVLISVMCVLVSAPMVLAQPITVSLAPSSSQVLVNDTFDIVISAILPDEIIGFGFDLLFDDALVQVTGTQIADPFVPLHTPDGDGLAGLSYPNTVSGTNINLATVSLLALSPGLADISIGVTPGDLTEGFSGTTSYLDFVANPTSVEIVSDTPLAALGGGGGSLGGPGVPEPATIGFFIIGCMLTFCSRRRR